MASDPSDSDVPNAGEGVNDLFAWSLDGSIPDNYTTADPNSNFYDGYVVSGQYSYAPWDNGELFNGYETGDNFTYNYTYILATAGCQPNVPGPVNCTAACNNDTWLFTSLYAISSCFTASLIAANLTDITDPATVEQANALGMYRRSPSISTPNTTHLFSTLGDCFDNYCKSTGICASEGSDCQAVTIAGVQNLTVAANSLQNCVSVDICPSTPDQVNSDLGGIGVFISYYIQFGICFVGFIALIILNLSRVLGHYYRTRFSHKGRLLNNAVVKRLPATTDVRMCLIAALQEFQRTQCFFVLAIQIASLISLRMGLQPETIGQAVANYTFMAAVAQNNLCCVSFLFWYLRRNLDKSLYTLILSWTSIIVTCVTLILVSNQSIQPSLTGVVDGLVPGTIYDFCSNTNPIQACNVSLTPVFGAIGMFLLFGLLLMVVCLIEDYTGSLARWLAKVFASDPSMRKPFTNIKALWTRTVWTQLAFRLFWFLGMLILLGWFLFYMVSNCFLLSNFIPQGEIDEVDWGFGQIVAVSVWAEPLMEFVQLYLHALTRKGFKHSFSHRLPRGFTIKRPNVQREQKSSTPKPSQVEIWLKRIELIEDVLFCGPAPWETLPQRRESRVPPAQASKNNGDSADVGASGYVELRPSEEITATPDVDEFEDADDSRLIHPRGML